MIETKKRALQAAGIAAFAASLIFGLTNVGVSLVLGDSSRNILVELATTLLVIALSGGVLFVFLTRLFQRQELAEEMIRAGEERFRQAINNFPYGVTIYDPDLRIRFLNNYARRQYGREADHLIGMTDRLLLPPDDSAKFVPILEAVRKEGRQRTLECEFRRGQSTHTELITFVPTFRPDGELREIISIQIDMTAFKAMGQRVRSVDRSLKMLVAANTAVALSTSESHLFAGFCEALVESGGFRSAAIGRPTADHRFGPIAAVWGHPPIVNRQTWSEEQWNPQQLQVCKVFHTGELCHNGPDCGTGEFLDWEQQQPQADQTQRICVPIKLDDRVECVLRLVSSPQLGADETDLETLRDLAASIGVALKALRADAALSEERFKLGERVKEMQCLSSILQRLSAANLPTAEDWEFVVAQVPPGFLHPEDTFVRLTVNGSRFESRPFQETARQIGAAIGATGEIGVLEVFIADGDNAAFLPEEQVLIDAIADAVQATVERHAALKRERASTNRFEETFEQTAVGMAHCSPEGHIIRLNSRFAAIIGGTPDTLFGKTLHEICPSPDAGRVSAVLDNLIAGRSQRESLESRCSKSAGLTAWVNLTVNLVRDAEDKPAYFILVLQDVSEQRRAAEAVRESEERFRAVVEASPDGIMIANLEGRFLTASPRSETMLGYSLDELLDMSITDIDLAAQAQGAEKVRQMWTEIFEGRLQTTVEGLHRRKDGSTYPAEISISPLIYRGQPAVMGLVRDVSERRAAEAQMRLHESALNATTNSVMITDKDANIVWVNPAFTKVSGYSLEEAVGQNPRILKSGQQSPEYYRELWATLADGRTWTGRLINRRKDGDLYHENAIITPVPDNKGEITHYIAIKQNITAQVELEQQLHRAQRMESIGLLAGGIAHDLNNVLAPILMAVEMLRLDAPKEEVNEVLKSLEESVQRGAGIIRQVLTFARGSDGEKALLQTRHLLKEIVKIAKETFPRDIEIRSDLSSNLWPVIGDPTQIHQILLNLAVNARDAMANGGTLRFAARNEELAKGREFLNLSIPAGSYIRMTVTDTGSGMSDATLHKIFEPFFTTKEKGKGTGLGLATVMGIVKGHNGLIEVTSTPGEGTTFSVWLPATPTEPTAVEQDDEATVPQGGGQTILVVDDEPEILKLTCKILTNNGYRTETAPDGAAAVAIFAADQQRFAAVISDIMMPFMDGVALTRSIKKLRPDIPILIASGLMDQDVTKDRSGELRDLGVRTILRKPFTIRELLEPLAEEIGKPV